jgi:DNA processing protein
MKIHKIGSNALRKLIALNPDLWYLWWHSPKHHLQLILSKEQIQQWQHYQTNCPLSLDQEALRYNQLGVEWIPFDSPRFPPALREIHDPPAGLFLQGSLDGLLAEGQQGLAVVGTRKMSPYGKQMTEALVSGLKQSPLCIVSGLALGIDGVAHQTALATGLPTIAFLGCGLDTYYPEKHKGLAHAILAAGGGLISEYPLGVAPLPKLFPRRNRLVVGVSTGVLIIEAPVLSGSMITARLGIEENRVVMAIPHEATGINAAGPLKLLKDGAGMVWESLHILQELGLAAVENNPTEKATQLHLTETLEGASASQITNSLIEKTTLAVEPSQKSPENPQEKQVWQAVLACNQAQGISLEKLQMQLAPLSTTEISGHLMMLELDGWVTALAGGRFIASVHTVS